MVVKQENNHLFIHLYLYHFLCLPHAIQTHIKKRPHTGKNKNRETERRRGIAEEEKNHLLSYCSGLKNEIGEDCWSSITVPSLLSIIYSVSQILLHQIGFQNTRFSQFGNAIIYGFSEF